MAIYPLIPHRICVVTERNKLTLGKVDQKYLEGCEMCSWRRMEKISWTDRVGNKEVLQRVKEERSVLHSTKTKTEEG